MNLTKKEEKYKQEIENDVLEEDFPTRIPEFPRMHRGKRDEFVSNTYIIEDESGKNFIMSGGYKIFLWMCDIAGGREFCLSEVLKNKRWAQYKEFLRIEKRENTFGVRGKIDNTAKGFREFDMCEIILEKIDGDALVSNGEVEE